MLFPNSKAIVTWRPFLTVCSLFAVAQLALAATLLIVGHGLFDNLSHRANVRDRQTCEMAAIVRAFEPLIRAVDPAAIDNINKFLADVGRNDPKCSPRPDHALLPITPPVIKRGPKRIVVVPSSGKPVVIPAPHVTVTMHRSPHPPASPPPSRHPSPRHPSPHPSHNPPPSKSPPPSRQQCVKVQPLSVCVSTPP